MTLSHDLGSKLGLYICESTLVPLTSGVFHAKKSHDKESWWGRAQNTEFKAKTLSAGVCAHPYTASGVSRRTHAVQMIRPWAQRSQAFKDITLQPLHSGMFHRSLPIRHSMKFPPQHSWRKQHLVNDTACIIWPTNPLSRVSGRQSMALGSDRLLAACTTDRRMFGSFARPNKTF